MQYINNTVRRQDRLMDERRAMQLLHTAEYGVLSMVSEGSGYGIPVNFVFDGDHSIYIHCAPEGRKLEAIKANKNVSLCVIGHVHLLPDKFTTEYESAIFFGEAQIGLSEDERMHALQLLINKMSPDYSADRCTPPVDRGIIPCPPTSNLPHFKEYGAFPTSSIFSINSANILRLLFLYTLIIWAFYSILKKDKE